MTRGPLFKKAAVVGVGHIGGSLAWAIKKRKLAGQVVGVAKKSHVEAKKLGAIDAGFAPERIAEALKGADLVVLAMPVSLNEAFVKNTANAKLLAPGAVVIDVGSTKARISAVAAKSPFKKNFVGCHPMAGSEKSGAAHADANLFEGAVCFVTRRDARVEKLWKSVGATPIVLEPNDHDAWVAHSSHLPHALAFLLFAGFPVSGAQRFRPNPSVRDLARIARSAPALWTEIFESNLKELLPASRAFESRLRAFNRALAKRDSAGLKRLIAESNRRSERAFLK